MAIEGKDEIYSGRIRLGMVGGGSGAFIGGVHRMVSRLDDHYTFVAGALSSTPEKALASGKELGLDPERIYGSYEEMAEKEAAREDGIEAVAIVTPNHMHFGPAKAFLEKGIHVICDKPVTSSLAEAKALKEIADKADALFILTHNYTGYPMIRQARAMIENGDLGDIRLIHAEYPQDWLTEPAERAGSKQAEWRTDPKRSGAGGAIGDIGTHALNLALFVSGAELESLAADLDSFVEGRQLDDNAHIMLRFKEKNGVKPKGMLWASQVAPGFENGLQIKICGTKGGIQWAQENPNYLWYTPFGEPKRLLSRNGAGALDASTRVSRIPAGHPEGYLEGFANIYTEAALAIKAFRDGKTADDVVYPTIEDGVIGLAFIEACVASSKADGKWVGLDV
ncbi:Gfo/Idh/MocA family oxidoreductase [Martelella lutilitoris]|uniref:Gfo/Idh/MocA family oxidoreductase n=1 Tax=Martelella lutilitoris TaxID=2583532 RepID=A0A5C4JTS3_9HYPH|nr:Gfo/Idh/MocA family oxidoreductase [Martelella lutilitoris]TNB48813.1 Gfo/Idh/MocA family oxidoreductase [Martelella lutilitoris]